MLHVQTISYIILYLSNIDEDQIMAILGLKLVTGEQLFGDVENTQDGRIRVRLPVTLRLMPSKIQGAEPSMAFVPFPEWADPESNLPLYLEPLHVAYTFVPHKEFISEYNDMVNGETGSPQIITG